MASTEISFMLVEHTKFCSGLRRSEVGCLEDITKVVDDSAVVNVAQLIGREDGTIIVHHYNW